MVHFCILHDTNVAKITKMHKFRVPQMSKNNNKITKIFLNQLGKKNIFGQQKKYINFNFFKNLIGIVFRKNTNTINKNVGNGIDNCTI